METAIKVRELSKRYRIGERDRADTFGQQLGNLLTYPIKNLRRIANLTRFSEEDDPTVFWALRDINFDVPKGDVLGIIGHNGAGKSTLLKILSRITEPTTGEIEIRGRVSSLLEVGTGFHPELSGRDNVYMNGTILGMRKREIDAKFDEIVAFSGVSKHIDTPVKFYSSGMTVRLAFSVAAHLEPEILIIDEVLAVGDAEFQKKCLGKMEDVAGQGRTVLFVSHNLAAVQKLCPQSILLKSGRKVFDGPTRQAIQQYTQIPENISDDDLNSQHRLGTGEIKFKRIRFRQDRQIQSSLHPGIPFEIEAYISVEKALQVKSEFAFNIYSQLGVLITTLDASISSDQAFEVTGDALLTCLVPELSLVPGNYYLSIWAGTSNQQFDYIERAIGFSVEKTDHYDTGKMYSSDKHGFLLTKSIWELKETI